MNDLRIVTALPQSLRPAYEALLASAGLRDEGDADCTALLSSDGGALLACGSVSGRVLKQIAVAPWAEGDGACARIVTALLEESARRGVAHPFLYTKPKNARLFRSLGFFPVVETVDMLMMEHRRGGVERYIASLPAYDGESGAVVCHANPFTRGHRHLVEYAAARCPHLYVFVLSEETGDFPAADRLELVRPGHGGPSQRGRGPRRGLYHLPGHLPRLFPPGGPGAGPVRPRADPVRKAHRPGPGHHPAVRGPGALLPGDGPL